VAGVSAESSLRAGDDTIKVLIVDDNPIDAELACAEFLRGGVAARCTVAANEAALHATLLDYVPDVVLCDFSFPDFDGFTAQHIVREAYPNVPIIFLSGTISEDHAAQAFRNGAVDYVLKTNLARLPSAVQRAVRSSRLIADAQERLHDEEERSRLHAQRLEALLQVVNDPTLGDAEKWLAMLGQAVTSLGARQGYRGMLWRVHGADMTLEAIAQSPGHVLVGSPQIGDVVSLSKTVVGRVLADGGGTRSWDDIANSPYGSEFARMQGTRSLVITTFSAGGAKWALTFSSGRRASIPLAQQDHAYIEVIASFFSKHMQQRRQIERIQYQQSHDVLTGLVNRSQFRSQACAGARTTTRYAIVVVDINAFHEINEAYGHTVADALLVEIGNALRGCAATDEIVGRVGGDAFGIFIPNPPSHEHLRGRTRDFAGVFARSFAVGEGRGFIARTASIGVAVAPDDGQDVDAVHSHADAALAAAKLRGQGSIAFYETGMEGDAPRRAALRTELVEACTEDQLTLHYQPHVDLTTGDVTGCEALLRWNHPRRGLLGPDDFIPFAEQTGIITTVDAWVMRNAFAVAGEISERRPGFRLYFNVSGRTAGDPKLIRAFIDAARSGVSLANVGLEITETDVMRDVEQTRRVFRALRRLNVRVAIDDFGTGYSSLSSLKRLPVDIVKIDRSFVSGVTSNPDDAAIADTIISIAQHFGFESMGEGAEDPAAVDWLREHGCRYVQGYAVCHPLPLGAFKAWLGASRSRALGSGRRRRFVEASSAGSRRLMPA
jgi:diguanylate cyclase (GGDEF)-like protein